MAFLILKSSRDMSCFESIIFPSFFSLQVMTQKLLIHSGPTSSTSLSQLVLHQLFYVNITACMISVIDSVGPRTVSWIILYCYCQSCINFIHLHIEKLLSIVCIKSYTQDTKTHDPHILNQWQSYQNLPLLFLTSSSKLKYFATT